MADTSEPAEISAFLDALKADAGILSFIEILGNATADVVAAADADAVTILLRMSA